MWSAPALVTAPAAEPVTLAAAKEYLRIDDDAQDLDVATFIKGARAHIEQLTSTRLITQTIEVEASCFGDLALLPVGPVQSVTAISHVDDAGERITIDPADYVLAGIGLARGIMPAPGKNWPRAPGRRDAVRVRLVVGYGAAPADVPGELQVALLMQIRALADRTECDVMPWIANARIWVA